jgi:hypothetical protein
MKETTRRRITVTSSSNEISTNQLGNKVVSGGGRGGGGSYCASPHSFKQQASGQIFKDDVHGFTSISIFLHGRERRHGCNHRAHI